VSLRPLGRVLALFLLSWPAQAFAADPPEIRVGLLGGAAEAVISSEGGGLRVVESGAPPRSLDGPLRYAVRAAEPATPTQPSSWFVDVREEKDARQARRVAEALKSSVSAPLEVERRGSRHAVVAGPFETLEAAAQLQELLASAGMSAASLREVAPTPARRSRLVRVDADWTVTAVAGESAVLRADRGRLLLDGKPYRGELRVSVDSKGLLRVVNAVPLEAYLRGVVPEELGPNTFGELEALSAQAVAARTWVLTQLGRHEAEGYDVCPTPHCQVYGGAGAEHELSDRAVFGTLGRVLGFEGEPATAYFSSTCGGHTEAVENVFDHPPVPYLKGVSCYPESVTFTRLAGRPVEADWQRADGGPAHDILARLWAIGLLDDSDLTGGGFTKRAKGPEAAAWLRAAASATGLRLEEGAAEALEVGTAISFLASLEQALGWGGRAALLDDADLAAASRFSELRGLEGAQLRSALLAQKGGLLPPGLGRAWAEGRLSRGNVLEVLDAWLESRGHWKGEAFRFLGRDGGDLLLLSSGERVTRSLADEPVLLSGRKGRSAVAATSLEFKLSDKLYALGPPNGPARLLLLEEDPDGAAFDRTSIYSWWERRTSFEEVARQAKRRAGVDRLADLQVKRISAAGRVVSVELTDRRGRKTMVEGFSARGLLGLPDSRAQIEVERDSAGKPVAVRATGRGWGHGVGLCQFGAYGMALAGRSHEEILGHYFPGAPLTDLSRLRLPDGPR
jgi:stage II sporulation protein D